MGHRTRNLGPKSIGSNSGMGPVRGPWVATSTLLPLLTVNGSTKLRLPLIDRRVVTLQVDDLEIDRFGEISMLQAAATAEQGGILSSFGFGGLLPFEITQIAIAAADEDEDGTPDARTIINRDANGDGLPDGDLDFVVIGDFDFTPLESFGVTPSVSVGGVDNAFELQFRVVDSVLKPWNTGPITIGMQAGPYSGLTFSGSFTTA